VSLDQGPLGLYNYGSFAPGTAPDAPATEATMKADIHPKYREIKVLCSCGNTFMTKSTLGRELHIEVCSACHPFYTGQQKMLDTGGRVDQFRKRYRRA